MRPQPHPVIAHATVEGGAPLPGSLAPARGGGTHVVGAAALGSALMTVTTWQTAATPWARPGLGWLIPEFVVFYVGLAILTTAWLTLGRRLLDPDSCTPTRTVRGFALAGAAPFLLAAPFGRDLWAYAGQGHLLTAGLSPYEHGPGAAAGAFTRHMSARWLTTPSPYGPLWLRVSHAAVWVSHGHPVVAALLLRLPAFLGLALCAWAVPVLAGRLGVHPPRARRDAAPRALWLGVASPLMLVLGVGGGHNDVLMLGLALAGIATATRPGLTPLALGAAIATLGVLVKSPAAIAMAFTAPASLATDAQRGASRVLSSCLAAVLGCAAPLLGVTAVSGLGFGWARQSSSYAGWVNCLSLPSALTMLGKALAGNDAPRGLDGTLHTARTAGEIVTVVLLVALWLLAVRRPARTAGCLALAFGVSAILAPAVQPWYYLWGLVVAGLAVRRHAGLLVLAGVGLVFPLLVLPFGTDLDNHWVAVPVVAVAGWLVRRHLGRERPVPAPRRVVGAAGAARGRRGRRAA